MDNQQLNLNDEQIQVIISGKFGDGYLTIPKDSLQKSIYKTNCKFEEYLIFKKNLLGSLCEHNNINHVEHNGYSQTRIFTLQSKSSKDINYLRCLNLQSSLNYLNELGLAMWLYDDGSLHKNKLFYNINTQAFSWDIQEELFIPFFHKFNIFPKITQETKKDGRVFYYLRVSKYEGAYEINKILEKYPLTCYVYKRWSSETIQKWSKLQEKLKSTDIDIKSINNYSLAKMLRKISI